MSEPFKLVGTDLFYHGMRVGVIFEPPVMPTTVYDAMKAELLNIRADQSQVRAEALRELSENEDE